jgi:methyltransferase
MIHPLYLCLLVLTGLERMVELRLAHRNGARVLAQGGWEMGQEHYPWMVVLHTAFLAGCLLEPMLAGRPFLPALAVPMLALVVAAHAVRWACIYTLGERWNTRIIVLPGQPRVTTGLYRWLSHPNYAAVVVEGFALPLVHYAWITAASFTVMNAFLLRVRIQAENKALATAEAGGAPL